MLHTPAESGAGGDDNAAEEDEEPGKQEYVSEEDEDCGGHTTSDPPGVGPVHLHTGGTGGQEAEHWACIHHPLSSSLWSLSWAQSSL